MTTIADALLDRIQNRREEICDLASIIDEGIEARHGLTLDGARATLEGLRAMQQHDETALAEIEV